MRHGDRGPNNPHRRSVIIAGTALIGVAALTRAVPAAGESGLAPAVELTDRAQKFLASLEPDKRKSATFAWSGSEWRSWNYFGVAGYIKPGLRLEQMSAPQKAAAWDLMAAVWSPARAGRSAAMPSASSVSPEPVTADPQ